VQEFNLRKAHRIDPRIPLSIAEERTYQEDRYYETWGIILPIDENLNKGSTRLPPLTPEQRARRPKRH